ncbi:HAD family hydrolase [Staphylococcus simiae]|uniref:HAD family hydrolase n=1 Tax=Staphylococcus simiae TaxID=308354 RepID=UPI001A963C1F|nr:HAD family hydrolase [Staphylococcus simiae]MBO1199425.1 HAD family hydrolase [Staphylococcus simiae]MBO1201882.1 HAD family hydrolase [Staphylococcus simiae]MBO1204096.1 HAD family hydrolase [Staphylococcus simiae]MBO1211137.1 HAD family hydrolase [Staphylococcus simiae]MBO1230331.1 HAD family hydrolase [Staphylococcus simiae]
MKLKLVVTDMDGTFLNPQGDIDHEAFRQLKARCQSNDITFAFCTGKQCERVAQILDGLEQDTYIVGDSATRIQYNHQTIWAETFNKELGLELIERLRHIDPQQTVIVCTDNKAYVQRGISDAEQKIVHGSYENVEYINDYSDISEDFVKVTVHDANKACIDNATYLKDFEDRLYVVAADAEWIDIAKKGVHKGSTMEQLQQRLGVDASETIVFGDGLNDIELFKIADTRVAMDNAYPELKEHADIIAKSNQHNGVIHTLNTLLDLYEA